MKISKWSRIKILYFNYYKQIGLPTSNLPEGVKNFNVGGFYGYSGGIYNIPWYYPP